MRSFARGAGITEIPGIGLGTVTRDRAPELTGTTVVVPPPGSMLGVDVRGGGPATHETAILEPGTLPYGADAVVLTGGSAYGLTTASGVQSVLAEAGRGFPAPGPGLHGVVVPIVPAAAVFDLGRGGPGLHTPTEADGALAARRALGEDKADPVVRGSIGAGTGAWTGRGMVRGGQGSVVLTTSAGHRVAALVVANPMGAPLTREGTLLARPVCELHGIDLPPVGARFPAPESSPQAGNTTIAVVATDAALDAAQTTRLAASAHAGIARAVHPSHTLFDGDTVFGLATGGVPVPDDSGDLALTLVELGAAAADALTLAILDAVCAAEPHPADAPGPRVPALVERAPEFVAAWRALD